MGKKQKQLRKNTDTGIPMREQIKPIFKERFTLMLGSEEEYQKFEDCILTPQRKSFRINSQRVEDTEQLANNIRAKGITLTPVPWCKNAYFTEYNKEARSDLGNLYEHFTGRIYVQEATSMSPPELLEIPEIVDKNFKVLDMCSSPGSKTTQIADLMKGEGILIANELDFKRLGPLKINLERAGYTNIVITNQDASRIKGEEIFDRICCDAPCSGSGVIRKSPKTIKSYNPKKLHQMQNLQISILQRGFELLKKGGIITYSTCSIDPEENELCIKRFLEANGDAILEQATLPGLILTHKLTSFYKTEISKEITERTIRIWPQDNDTNGFYVAKIRKSE
jgi:NOL1/NOP2/sun family putative RNA methylase